LVAQAAQCLLGVLAGAAEVVVELGAFSQPDPQVLEAVQTTELPAER